MSVMYQNTEIKKLVWINTRMYTRARNCKSSYGYGQVRRNYRFCDNCHYGSLCYVLCKEMTIELKKTCELETYPIMSSIYGSRVRALEQVGQI